MADPYLPPDGYGPALGWYDAMHDEGAVRPEDADKFKAGIDAAAARVVGR